MTMRPRRGYASLVMGRRLDFEFSRIALARSTSVRLESE